MHARIGRSRVRRSDIVELLRRLKIQSLIRPSYATILQYICMDISLSSPKSVCLSYAKERAEKRTKLGSSFSRMPRLLPRD